MHRPDRPSARQPTPQTEGLLRILVIGKYPPIQGGTSVQTLATVRALAERGHHIDVVTNAAEVEPGCGHLCTAEDARALAALTGSASSGSVTVHATTPLHSTSYIPWAQPYASKLFGLAVHLVSAQRFDLVVGWYLEPYGLVAAQIAETARIPLLLRHAGSDVGRLADHPDLGPAYRWALRHARFVLTGPRARAKLIELGADPETLLFADPGNMPDYFSVPFSPLDLDEIQGAALERFGALDLPESLVGMLADNFDRRGGPAGPDGPVIGVYGKVAPSKGSHDLLAALEVLAADGVPFTLLGAVGGQRDLLVAFLEQLERSEHLRRRTVLLPFLPPWRIPAFLDRCDLVCFLERQFDVAVHRTRVPLEVLLRGRTLVLSGEAADQLLFARRLVDGRHYVRVEDPTDIVALASVLGRYLADPETARTVAEGGRALAALLLADRREDGPAAAVERAISALPARPG